jgi:hypothetical protein
MARLHHCLMSQSEFQTLPDSLLDALAKTQRGLGIFSRSDQGFILSWGNASFFRILGVESKSAVGREAKTVLGAMGSAKSELDDAIGQRKDWLGWSEGFGASKVKVRLEMLGRGAMALWLEGDESASMNERMADAMRQVEECSGMDEKNGFGGPKAFWRSVGSLWAVCARNQLPISLAMVVTRPKYLGHAEANYEEASKQAFSCTFRRASDIVGRLGQNSYAVFIVGQDALGSKERLEKFALELGSEHVSSVGIASGLPTPGSTTQGVKSLAKKMLDKAIGYKESHVEAGTF